MSNLNKLRSLLTIGTKITLLGLISNGVEARSAIGLKEPAFVTELTEKGIKLSSGHKILWPSEDEVTGADSSGFTVRQVRDGVTHEYTYSLNDPDYANADTGELAQQTSDQAPDLVQGNQPTEPAPDLVQGNVAGGRTQGTEPVTNNPEPVDSGTRGRRPKPE